MRLVPQLAKEFEEFDNQPQFSQDPQGKDILTLTRLFADENEAYEYEPEDYQACWNKFLYEHRGQVNVQMAGMIIYLLLTYWERGRDFYEALPEMDRLVFKYAWFGMEEEIRRQMAAKGNVLQPDMLTPIPE